MVLRTPIQGIVVGLVHGAPRVCLSLFDLAGLAVLVKIDKKLSAFDLDVDAFHPFTTRSRLTSSLVFAEKSPGAIADPQRTLGGPLCRKVLDPRVSQDCRFAFSDDGRPLALVEG